MASTTIIRIEGVKEAFTDETAHFDLQTNVTAELKSLLDESVSKATVSFKSESAPGVFTYEITYTPTIRGRHELSVRMNGVDVSGSPFKVFVQHPPNQLGKPFKVLNGLQRPMAAVGPQKRVYIASSTSQTVTVFDKRPVLIQKIGGYAKLPFEGDGPQRIATDDDGNMYMTTMVGRLLKVDENGESIESLAVETGYSLRGVKVHNGRVFVCDMKNSKVQVFDADLKFIKSFHVMDGSGKGPSRPMDLSFDAEGNIYITCEYSGVQVVDGNGQYLRHFGQKSEGDEKLGNPRGIHVFGDHVYVSENSNHCISVFNTSGDFITSFGKQGDRRGELINPLAIAVDNDGFVYVCDSGNERVQVF